MNSAELIAFSARFAAEEIARGALTSEEYVGAYLDRIKAVEPEVLAFAHIDPDYALSQARMCDRHRASGLPLGPLHGIPIAIKDIIDTRDYPTECGSRLMSGRRPVDDATVVARLRTAGAVIIGKAVTTELAYFSPGKTRNPHDLERTPGGSSSGSAAAVAAGMVPLALGTQTNGSVIRPASFCGVYGIKPGFGLISRAGVLTLSPTLDHVGCFARTIEDVALLLEVVAGYDAADDATQQISVPRYVQDVAEDDILPPRLAFIKTPIWDRADASTQQAFGKLAQQLGQHCITIDLPGQFADAWDAQRKIMAAEMAYNLGGMTDRDTEKSSAILRELIAEGRKVDAAGYLSALADGRAMRNGLLELFQQQCGAIITPAAPGVAPMGLSATGSPAFCTLWTLTGLPAISLPLLTGDDGMPLGVQLVGPPNGETRLLQIARWLAEILAD